jgi:hypothetical protein
MYNELTLAEFIKRCEELGSYTFINANDGTTISYDGKAIKVRREV